MAHPSGKYVHGHHESVLRSHTWRTATNSAAYLLPSLKPDMTILDIGCGPGTLSADLATFVPQGKVIGLENAPAVLETARAIASQRGIANIEFVEGDVHNLAYPDNTFDVVHAHQVLQHVANPVHALKEMRRVAKPGGFVAAREADMLACFWYPESKGLTAYQKLYDRVYHSTGGEPNAGRRLHVWARLAGFEKHHVKATGGSWCYNTPEEASWWGGLQADRILSSNFAEMAVSGGFTTEQELKQFSSAWREWSKDQDAWYYIPHGEIICAVQGK